MFKHPLVPLDGSTMVEAALPAAAFLAEKFASRVTLMHAVERNAPHEVHGQSHLRNAREASDYLNVLAQRAFTKGIAVDIHVHEAEVDNVAESIVAHADELKHDLIIMCSHGRGKSLHLVIVVPRFSSLTGEAKITSRMLPTTASRILELEYKDAQVLIQTETETLRGQVIEASGHALRGDPAEMVANATNSSNIDLTVVATHGKTGMKAFWEG